MKNLNQLVCITILLSCAQAFRSYVRAVAKQEKSQKFTIVNGTDWQIRVGYTAPQNPNSPTSDSIEPGASKTITVLKSEPTSYVLLKEKVHTATRIIPAGTVDKGTFEITPETIKDLIQPYVTPVVVQAAPTAAPATHAAPHEAHTAGAPAVAVTVTTPQNHKGAS